MLISRTPYRISLAGGGTDFPEWFKHHPSAVVSGTINKYSYITCRPLDKFFDHNYRIVYSLIENVLDIEDVKHPAVREVIKFLEYKRMYFVNLKNKLLLIFLFVNFNDCFILKKLNIQLCIHL